MKWTNLLPVGLGSTRGKPMIVLVCCLDHVHQYHGPHSPAFGRVIRGKCTTEALPKTAVSGRSFCPRLCPLPRILYPITGRCRGEKFWFPGLNSGELRVSSGFGWDQLLQSLTFSTAQYFFYPLMSVDECISQWTSCMQYSFQSVLPRELDLYSTFSCY